MRLDAKKPGLSGGSRGVFCDLCSETIEWSAFITSLPQSGITTTMVPWQK